MRQEWDKYQRRQKALGNPDCARRYKATRPQRQTVKSPENDAKTTGKGRRKSAKLKAEQDKNKVLLQQLADRFKVERGRLLMRW
jgi:hypothetical protein